MPDIEEDLDVEINPDDLRIDTYRSSGAGGQHLDKDVFGHPYYQYNEIPVSVKSNCASSRTDKAMQMLKAKLYMLKQQENAEKLSDIRGEVKEIGWGNQIRSYVLPTLHDGKGSSYRRRTWQCRQRTQRQPGSIYQRILKMAESWMSG